MKTDISLSTRFTQSQGSHQVGLLVSVGADQPPVRTPINVALVLDRSGSMSGEPIRAAREAVCRFASFLAPHDRLSLVAFNHEVQSIFTAVPGGDPAIEQHVRSITADGYTNLSGGWLKGHELCAAARVKGVNRVVLFTDGQANQGITDITRLGNVTRGAVENGGVSTSCFGFGADFNGDLMKEMARAGRGNFWYIEQLDQMSPVFDEEIEGLVSLAAQNVEIELRLLDPRVQGVTFLQDYTVGRTPDGRFVVLLGDVYATAPRLLGVRFHVEHPEALGKAKLAEVKVRADVVRAAGIEHTEMTMPVVANLDGEDHVEPVVERTLLRFEAAQARAEAAKQADRGDFAGAAKRLIDAAMQLLPHSKHDKSIAEEVGDLQAQAERIRERKWDDKDRHYHLARTRGVWEQKAAYVDKIKRPRR